ncbi:SpoIID/LytB domain-containing protein [Paenibacillus filicis]|uniref:SpoIID/LytB domain-containing protein n=1 Tax=Paenibacillus gyeongsangnamensis TaxID=3388067 RepID=A0ABT4QCQ2_9BACL|nr:SpoIID/LytB domain-containing protein [Paenibacillus filicis]MCZ8514610.1 SpoIID/LytB domain-containing protein [Paenibacillus filicis]
MNDLTNPPGRGGWKLMAALGAALLGSSVTGIAAGPAYAAEAAVPKLDTIRVALFLETAKYSAPATSVTLSAEAGLALGLREAGGVKPVYAAGPQEAVRAYADGYQALLLETGDAAEAKALAQKRTAGGDDVAVVQRTRAGKPAYQVLLGPFATKEAAAAKAGAAAAVQGPLHLLAGQYVTAAEAQTQAAAIGAAGFDADAAVLGGDAGGYAVLVGAAADSAALQALQGQLAAALPATAPQPLAAAQPYALLRSELAVAADGKASPQQAAAFGGGTAAKLWAASAGARGTVTVQERFGRAYRGGIELSTLGGKLAVVNELPFEQYLVSVLGSELSKEWPMEALKAQAVAARTFALKQSASKYTIAQVTDTTLDQAYKGIAVEFPQALQAVQATEGEVLTNKGSLIDPLFYSNAGGVTADSAEVWGNDVPYLKSIASPDDGAAAGKKLWYRIVLPNGNTGFIHSDYARDTGQKNPAGLPYYESTGTGIAVRSAPYVDNAANPALFKVDIGDRFVVIGRETESNAYSWYRGPFDAAKLKDKITASLPGALPGGLDSLEVTKRGPSGRVLELKAGGQPLKTAYPDSLRSLLGGLPSTRFEIEDTGRYTILGADGTTRSQSAGSPAVYVTAAGATPGPQGGGAQYVLDGSGQVRQVTKTPQFIFRGKGNGHGVGMSQWGAKGYAELGYDYKKILLTYYQGVTITSK